MKITVVQNDGAVKTVTISGARGPQGPPGEAGPVLSQVYLPNATPSTTEGEVRYDPDTDSLKLRVASMELDLLLDVPVPVVNKSGAPMTKGQVVNVTGVQGQRPAVGLADASSEQTCACTIGVVYSDTILDNEEGYLLSFGTLTGIDTSSFLDGDKVWVSTTPGEFTAEQPEAPNHWARVGIVAYAHATQGSLFVRPNVLPSYNSDRVEPTGFLRTSPQTMGDMTFTRATRTFQIAPKVGQPAYVLYSAGKRIYKSEAESVVIADTLGVHIIYYDGSGTLIETTTFTPELITIYCIVAIIYWNPILGRETLVADERHGVKMDGASHYAHHSTTGTLYASGLNISGLSEGGTTFTQIATGTCFDEDIKIDTPLLSSAPFWFKNGSNAEWEDAAANTSLGYIAPGDTYVSYNQNVSGSVWQLTEMTSPTNAMLIHFVFTNDATYPIAKVLGEGVYASNTLAKNAILTEISTLSLAGLPSPEFLFIYTVVINRQGQLQTLDSGDLFIDLRRARGLGVSPAIALT